ncbi:MAG: hypothetical protein QM736_14700 [Vicinamibacterales bacterium]
MPSTTYVFSSDVAPEKFAPKKSFVEPAAAPTTPPNVRATGTLRV